MFRPGIKAGQAAGGKVTGLAGVDSPELIGEVATGDKTCRMLELRSSNAENLPPGATELLFMRSNSAKPRPANLFDSAGIAEKRSVCSVALIGLVLNRLG